LLTGISGFSILSPGKILEKKTEKSGKKQKSLEKKKTEKTWKKTEKLGKKPAICHFF